MIGRAVLAAVGVGLAAYGAVLLLTRQDPGQIFEVVVWLAAGVVAHDGLLAGAVLLLALVAHRLLPDPWRTPATVALVVWGSLTLVAVPMLGRFGARPDNPTLLDRPYVASWLVLLVVTLVAVAVAGILRSRSGAAGPAPESDDPAESGD